MSKKHLVGAAVALGAVMLVPGVAAALGRAGRPLLRAALKTGATGLTEFQRAGAEAYEHMEDIAAEVKAEMKAAKDAADAAADAADDAADADAPGGEPPRPAARQAGDA